MSEELINFDIPTNNSSIIKVIGVGGGGGNAVNHMHKLGIKDVDFIVCNTDAQALIKSPVDFKIQIGTSLTEGRGAGNKPDIGRQAAIESLAEIDSVLSNNTKMVFITAGMGGGTGTGAAPVIAKAAKELGVLTVAIVTIPFRFEGPLRINQAIEGLNELQQYVDSLLVINNEKLREIYGDLKLSQAFNKADDVLASAAKGIAEIITVPGYINVDFADVQTVMKNSGVALMGSSKAEGENRALEAIQGALSSPLLNNNDITGAQNILLNIASGDDEISMDEVGEITDFVNRNISKNALIIWGTSTDESLGNSISVTIIATGFETSSIPEIYIRQKQKKSAIELEDFEPRKNIPQGNFDETFEVKEKPAVHKEPSVSFDFTSKSTEDEQLFLFDDEKDDVYGNNKQAQKLVEKIKNQRKNYAYIKEKSSTPISDNSNIEELENEPAYLRKKVKIDNSVHSKESKISRYSLEEGEGERFAKLKSNNSYLHDQVD